jgi:hypothetical protein
MREKTVRPRRRAWQPMSVTFVGRVPDVILHGGGKLTCWGGDPGEPRKQRHHG